jgi:hypothetical protein
MEARISAPDAPAGFPSPNDAQFLRRVQLLNLITKFGELDVSFEPAGTFG